MWLSLLFSIFAISHRFLAVLVNDPSGPPATTLSSTRMDLYREKAVQCLVLAKYIRCPPYTVEAFLLYFVTEYFRSQDSQFGTWLLVGIIMRIAFRMGYHREPSRFPNISIFRAEMRRRIWCIIVQLDLMSSTLVGLPKMIQTYMYDAIEPRNLTDDDLYEDMTELPEARPDTDTTVMLYALVRNRVLHVVSQIVDLANSPNQPVYPDVLELDTSLRTVYEKLPPSMKAFRAKDFEYADTDVAMRRLYLGLTFLRAELMLHRPFLSLGRTDTRYEYSRLVCLDAALEILECQRELNAQAAPGGKLWSSKWRIWSVSWRLSSALNHDFLLATTVLSLELDRDISTPLPAQPDTAAPRVRFKEGQPTRAEIVEALTGAYDIWVSQSENSREAKKVAAAVRLVLGKANVDVGHDSTIGTLPKKVYQQLFAPNIALSARTCESLAQSFRQYGYPTDNQYRSGNPYVAF